MRAKIVDSTTLERGFGAPPRATRCTVVVTIYAIVCATAWADAPASSAAITPDPVERTRAPVVGTANFRPSWDLDGLYIWLGPTGAATHEDGWDSTFGGDLAIVRVRERELLSAIGIDLGASLWTARDDAGRIWLDVIAGTKLGARIYGVSVGPIIEFSQLEHPRYGGSIGAWAFFGITPFARVGLVEEMGVFGEVGIHIALPVWRH
jgi:hypothetical protein